MFANFCSLVRKRREGGAVEPLEVLTPTWPKLFRGAWIPPRGWLSRSAFIFRSALREIARARIKSLKLLVFLNFICQTICSTSSRDFYYCHILLVGYLFTEWASCLNHVHDILIYLRLMRLRADVSKFLFVGFAKGETAEPSSPLKCWCWHYQLCFFQDFWFWLTKESFCDRNSTFL